MTLLRWNRLPALGVGSLLLACGGGGGGGTGPCTPGLATQLTKTGGDAQAWYVNNPLPAALSVTARDANNCPVPGVAVDWTIQTGGGGLGATHSTTAISTRFMRVAPMAGTRKWPSAFSIWEGNAVTGLAAV